MLYLELIPFANVTARQIACSTFHFKYAEGEIEIRLQMVKRFSIHKRFKPFSVSDFLNQKPFDVFGLKTVLNRL